MADGRAPASRRASRTALLVAGPFALLLLAAVAWLAGGRWVVTDNAYLKADLAPVSPRIAGLVARVGAASHRSVRTGDVLFELEVAPLEVALARAEAALAAAHAEVAAQRATLARRRVERDVARTALVQAEREVARLEPLLERGIAPRSTVDRARYERDAAREQLVAAESAIGEAEAALGTALAGPSQQHPAVRLAAAEVARARLELDYAVVRAPVDGTLASVSLHPGRHVSPGEAVLHVVVGARPWIEANLKETQLGALAPGQPAEVRIDSYPGVRWRARLASISPATGAEFALLPPENASGNWVKIVQRVPVRLEFEGEAPPVPLRAGMSAEVRIDTGAPNLRWRRVARAFAAHAAE